MASRVAVTVTAPAHVSRAAFPAPVAAPVPVSVLSSEPAPAVPAVVPASVPSLEPTPEPTPAVPASVPIPEQTPEPTPAVPTPELVPELVPEPALAVPASVPVSEPAPEPATAQIPAPATAAAIEPVTVSNTYANIVSGGVLKNTATRSIDMTAASAVARKWKDASGKASIGIKTLVLEPLPVVEELAKLTCPENEWTPVTGKKNKPKAVPVKQAIAMCVKKEGTTDLECIRARRVSFFENKERNVVEAGNL